MFKFIVSLKYYLHGDDIFSVISMSNGAIGRIIHALFYCVRYLSVLDEQFILTIIVSCSIDLHAVYVHIFKCFISIKRDTYTIGPRYSIIFVFPPGVLELRSTIIWFIRLLYLFRFISLHVLSHALSYSALTLTRPVQSRHQSNLSSLGYSLFSVFTVPKIHFNVTFKSN